MFSQNNSHSLYFSAKCRILEKDSVNAEICIFKMQFAPEFKFLPGQFIMLTVQGFGEIALSPVKLDTASTEAIITLKKTGRVSSELFKKTELTVFPYRGPYGVPFPKENIQGKELMILSYSDGFVDAQNILKYVLSRRDEYPRISLHAIFQEKEIHVYEQLLKKYKREVEAYEHIIEDKVLLINKIDEIFKNPGFSRKKHIVYLTGVNFDYRKIVQPILTYGTSPENLYLMLHRKLSCGIGKCRKCMQDSLYICQDGPLFSYDVLKESHVNY